MLTAVPYKAGVVAITIMVSKEQTLFCVCVDDKKIENE